VALDWQAYDPARRGGRDRITREQAVNVRVGALCKVKAYEWYIPPGGTSEDIVESWQDRIIPFHCAGIGCQTCQGLQALAHADAIHRCEALAEDAPRRKSLIAMPFQYRDNLRLPTSVSTRNTYVKGFRRQVPTVRIAYLDVTERVMEQ